MSENKVRPPSNEFSRERFDAADLAASPAILDQKIIVFAPPVFTQLRQECVEPRPHVRIVLRDGDQHADAPRPLTLLRMRAAPPNDSCATEKRNEIASSHPAPQGSRPRRTRDEIYYTTAMPRTGSQVCRAPWTATSQLALPKSAMGQLRRFCQVRQMSVLPAVSEMRARGRSCRVRCGPVRRGAIYRRPTAFARHAGIASFAGARRVFGVGRWRLPPPSAMRRRRRSTPRPYESAP